MAQVICVVGMHRSGTSCLAGSLQAAGLYLGDVITQAPHNAKGNRENRLIMELQEDVLIESGGSWEVVPDRVVWSEANARRRDAIIERYAGHARWGFKDPRTLITLEGWLAALDDVRFVGTFRRPAQVVASLRKRNGGSVEHWASLWCAYNSRLLRLLDDQPFPLVEYGEDDETYRAAVARAADTLGLDGSAAAFYESELRRQRTADDAEIGDEARRIYDALRDRRLAM